MNPGVHARVIDLNEGITEIHTGDFLAHLKDDELDLDIAALELQQKAWYQEWVEWVDSYNDHWAKEDEVSIVYNIYQGITHD